MAGEEKRQTAEFISEAEEITESLHKDLFALEDMAGGAAFNPDLINQIFRSFHSLKGLAGMFGFGELQGLAHDAENLLDALRLGKVDLAGPLVDLLFRGVEGMGRLVEAKSKGAELPGVEGLRGEMLAAAASGAKAEAQKPAQAVGMDPKIVEVLTEYEEHRLNENIRRGNAIYRVTARFLLETFDTGLAELTGKIKAKGEILSTLPSGEASGEAEIVFDLIVGSAENEGAIQDQTKGHNAKVAVLTPAGAYGAKAVPPPQPAVAGGEAEGAEASGSMRSVSQTVRVDISRLDSLMNVVGELVVQRNTFGKIADRLRDQGLVKLAQQLGREVRILERKLADLQNGVMEARMVPVAQIFDRLARVVRKLARSENKQIELVTSGGETELDKLLTEKLADPLMHLIRNAIDHGIESPEERLRAGKPATGTVILKAYPQGNHVVIEVSDDGRGIDPEKIRAKAIAKGLLNPGEPISREDLIDFIYVAGFSTRDTASELSGRGVGMDVVKNNIGAMSGVLETVSKVGEGTTIRITLPITLAIIGGLVVEVRGRTYVVPVNSVQQCLRVAGEDLMTIESRQMIQIEGRTVPVVSLGGFFGLPEAERAGGKYSYVIVVGLAEKRLGLLADRLFGQQDIVIKPVGDLLADTPGIAGATELGGQTTVLVLDVGEIIAGSLGGAGTPRRAAERAG